jgi:hypothetical protein
MLERQREGTKAKGEGRYKGRAPTARAKSAELMALAKQGVAKEKMPSSLSLSLSLSSAPYAANVLTQGTSDGFKKVPGPLYVPVAPSAYRPNTSRPLSCENAGIGQTATGTTYAIFPPFHQLFLSTEGSKPMCIAQSKAQ